MMPKGQRTSEAKKQEIYELLKAGDSVAKIVAKLKIWEGVVRSVRFCRRVDLEGIHPKSRRTVREQSRLSRRKAG